MTTKVLFMVVFILGLIVWFSILPSNTRDWNSDQAILSYSDVRSNSWGNNISHIDNREIIRVYNIRNFTYRNTSDYDISYYNKTFNLSELESMYYIVEPFSDWEGAAHTFVSFGFGNKCGASESNLVDINNNSKFCGYRDYLAISIEIRKEKGESFSALKGLFKQYEIMYVVGDESDLVKLRSNFRNDQVFVYPINTTIEKKKEMLIDMLNRANSLRDNPEFYNTLTNTCTTNLMHHTNRIAPGRIPFSFNILAPGYSDELAYSLGLIDTNISFSEIRPHFIINDKAKIYENDSDFSNKIRGYS